MAIHVWGNVAAPVGVLEELGWSKEDIAKSLAMEHAIFQSTGNESERMFERVAAQADAEEALKKMAVASPLQRVLEETAEVLKRYPYVVYEAWGEVMRIALAIEAYASIRNDADFPVIEQSMELALLKDICMAYDGGASLKKMEGYEPALGIEMVRREARANYAIEEATDGDETQE